MRVTAQVKEKTRRRILKSARKLFAQNGFDAVTTRDLADAAGIASGTLFNYFATKERVLAQLAADAAAEIDFKPDALEAASLDEALFAHVAAALRKLRSFRKHLPALFDSVLSPLSTDNGDEAYSLRSSHLDVVARLGGRFGFGELPATALQLYWTLYIGVLRFWAHDPSPKQEDTLALLDDSMDMFVGWLDSRRISAPSTEQLKR
jgi:AcrR family transcriptional regulator